MLGYAAIGTKGDIDKAIQSARSAAAGWAGIPPSTWELIVLRAADAIENYHDQLEVLLIEESCSTIVTAQYKVGYSANLFRAAAGEARRPYGDTFPNDKTHRVSMVRWEPLGVAAVLSPFKSPLVLLVKIIVFALAGGNTIVAKPSE